MKLTRIVLIILSVVVLLAVALNWKREVEADSSAEHSFTVDVPMARVRKILVRTNAIKKIVAMSNAELVDQKWEDLDLDVDKPLRKRDWDVDGKGKITVKINDSYLGQHELTLNQTVSVEPELLSSSNSLSEPSGPIKAYETSLVLKPDENGNASFSTKLSLNVSTTANILTSGIVRRSIKSSAEDSLQKQEKVIREIIEGYSDKLLILPSKE